MSGPKRAVIVDPASSGDVGHHADVNRQLIEALKGGGWTPELWAEEVFEGCGYVDPRHWSDLGGTLHLAKRCEQQMAAELATVHSASKGPVAAWLMHTALPFQLLGLARLLTQQPGARVLVSLMFPPGETLEGAVADPAAEANARMALAALAAAIRQGEHRLELWFPARQTLELYRPLLESCGLEAAGVHGAVVGAGVPVEPSAPEPGPGVLLHWGDLKRGKGRGAALEVVQGLLDGATPACFSQARWLFHVHSHEPLPEAERLLLERAQGQIPGFHWIEGRVETIEMQRRLAGCDLALLAYDPVTYGQRSSGLLWCYGAARLAVGRQATAVGPGAGWLAREAAELGISWQVGEGDWLEALGTAGRTGRFTAYGEAVLGRSFAEQMVERLTSALA